MRHFPHLIPIIFLISRQVLMAFGLLFIKCTDFCLVHLIFPGEFRSVTCILPEIIIISKKLSHYIHLLRCILFHKLKQNFVSCRPLVINFKISILIIICSHVCIHDKWIFKIFFQLRHGLRKLSTVIVDFYHFFDSF